MSAPAPSGFDPNVFLHAETSEVNEKRPPLPEANPESPDEAYLAVIGEIKMEAGTIEKGDRAGEPWLAAVVPLKIEVPKQLQDSLKLQPTLTLTDWVMLDLTPGGKSIDNGPGKNRRQKSYRDALDMNKQGDVWSWMKAQGQVVKVKIKHQIYNGEIMEDIKKSLILRRS
jgi:hypothetical protein